MLDKIKSNIPNTITCLSLVCGCMAIIASFGYDTILVGSLKGYQLAFILIGVAAVCDFLDGAAARALHAYSTLGKELDSLSDLVSFGVAPGMLVFNTMSLYGEAAWPAFTALFIPVMGELRLARFNIDDRQTTSFLGLPIPANAIFWIGACAAINSYGYPGDIIMSAGVIVMSLLMVLTGLKMFSLKFKNFSLRENLRRYIIIMAAILFVVFCGVPGLAWTIILYLLMSLVPSKTQA
ncbi:CDP-diacylglycerol--serine O-phosphatidyltransferase [bacterium J10(2018)]|jgi:CDP-diacylglycerol--serine O-phosphatidyltransferase|uniref:CDP-diacylglycerol--serine O-phosphatidyltransferase n=1 Tax=Heminiphilus faecis TaxID=2601703 RepID=UPI000EF5CD8B|nr:CDP-diacylglycerol--serine O-phosphatidyltransferase [Heminiphilus faecis]RLT77499.1 CDP-diacylglycerol--serine O-phosphatidyltransferase [bacterium J10(2018)]